MCRLCAEQSGERGWMAPLASSAAGGASSRNPRRAWKMHCTKYLCRAGKTPHSWDDNGLVSLSVAAAVTQDSGVSTALAASRGWAADCAGAESSKQNTRLLFGFVFWIVWQRECSSWAVRTRHEHRAGIPGQGWTHSVSGAAGCIAPLLPKALIPGICRVCPRALLTSESISWKKQIPPKPAELESPCTSFPARGRC